jgi:LmbE family N-acetylglucosaminyl deacetylase
VNVTTPVDGSAPRSSAPDNRPRTKLPQAGSVLAVAARPGDESYYLGAVLDDFHARGTKVSALVFSLGEASPYNTPAGRLRAVRSFEFELAAFVLRVTHRLLVDYPDGGLDKVPEAERVHRVTEMIRKCNADLLLTLDDGPAEHLVCETVCAAGRATGIPVLGWTLPADVAGAVRETGGLMVPSRRPDEIDFAVHVSRTVQRRAMRAHHSQAAAEATEAIRLEQQGDREWLRWLVSPEQNAQLQGR